MGRLFVMDRQCFRMSDVFSLMVNWVIYSVTKEIALCYYFCTLEWEDRSLVDCALASFVTKCSFVGWVGDSYCYESVSQSITY